VAGGLSLLRSGSAAFRAIGAWRPHNIALLAAACDIAGQIEEAVTLLDEALQIVERTGERWLAAELNRHKRPSCCYGQGHSEAAEETVSHSSEHRPGAGGQALGITRCREHRPAPPRARARRAEAHDLLALSTAGSPRVSAQPDLKEAKALLDELR